MFIIYCCNIL